MCLLLGPPPTTERESFVCQSPALNYHVLMHLSTQGTGGMAELPFLDELTTFLVSQACQDLLGAHPNHTPSRTFRCPSSWLPWWTWAADPTTTSERKWLVLWRYYVSGARDRLEDHPDFAQIPAPLRTFVDSARRLQLNRTPGEDAAPPGVAVVGEDHPRSFPVPGKTPAPNANVHTHGMSPKKAHEVLAMTAYTSRLLSSLMRQGTSVRHVVDIGAGQVRVLRSSLTVTGVASSHASLGANMFTVCHRRCIAR